MPFAIGDVRVAARGEWLIDRIVATGSLVLRKLGGDRAGEMAAHRFLSSPFVSVGAVVETLAERTAEQCAGRRIVTIQDTTEVNFAGTAGRRRGFGPAANGRDPGFFIHPVIAVDVETEAVIGLVDAAIWTRPQARKSARRERAVEDKESMRWLAGCGVAAESLAAAAALTMIADRESDIYALFAQCPKGLHLIVRAAQDRALLDGGRLFDALAAQPVLARQIVRVAPRGPGDRGREATVELRAGSVRIARPRRPPQDAGASAIVLTLVEARESQPPPGKEALCWRLLTIHAAETAEDAARIVQLYRLRWRIEQVFRALKSDGLRLDDSQVADAERMFNLAALALAAAVRTIQLVDARDGNARPMTDVLDAAFSVPLQRLSRSLEGNTQRQKNPHPPDSLAFVAWVAARLGGWNCYYKPPGPKTMRNGWNQLAAMLAGYALATANADL